MHVALRSAGGRDWVPAVVYASPNFGIKRHLWAMLDEIDINEPWLIQGGGGL